MIVLQIVVNWQEIKTTLFAEGLPLSGIVGGSGINVIPPVGDAKPPSVEEPPEEAPPEVPEIPVLAAHYTPATRG